MSNATTAINAFVGSIASADGLNEDPTAGYYRMLFVDGSLSDKGIDGETLQDGDRVEFQLKLYNEAEHGKTVHAQRPNAYLSEPHIRK